MSALSIFIIYMFINGCLFASVPPFFDDEITETKPPDPWVVTTIGQPSPHQPQQPTVVRPPFIPGVYTQGQWEYIRGLLLGIKYSTLTELFGPGFREYIPDGSGINSDYTGTQGYVCVGYKACPGDRRYFLEFDSAKWVKRPCPYGHAFDDSSCDCSTELQPVATTLASPSNTLMILTTTSLPELTRQTTATPTSAFTLRTTTASTTQASTTTTERTTDTSLAPATSTNIASTLTTILTPITTEIITVATTTQAPISSTETTTRRITAPETQLCSAAVTHSNSGFTRLPGSCDIFVQCRFVGDSPSLINTRRCPSGLLWNQNTLTCDFARNVNCVSERSCYNKRAVPENKGEYLLLTKNGWIVSFCPDGTGYNESTCSCSDKLVYEHLHPQCPERSPISDDPRGFLEFNGVTWTYVPCPDTLVYDHSSCACSFALADPYLDSGQNT